MKHLQLTTSGAPPTVIPLPLNSFIYILRCIDIAQTSTLLISKI